jgi:hypothetical protein
MVSGHRSRIALVKESWSPQSVITCEGKSVHSPGVMSVFLQVQVAIALRHVVAISDPGELFGSSKSSPEIVEIKINGIFD